MTALKHSRSFRPVLFVAALSMLILVGTGCENTSNTLKGTGIGAAAGAVFGGVIGKATGKTTTGVLVGGAVGATAGAIIGRQMDKQAEELENELEGASVERVGDGIKVTFDSAILFAVNSSDLSDRATSDLRDMAASLNDYENTNILIVGHTDSTGDADYNQTLSEQRAQSAAIALANAGVSTDRLEILGQGESEPVADNSTVDGRQQNRRVEVAIYASEEYIQELEKENG